MGIFNSAPTVPLSNAERQMIKDLEKDCKCEVQFRHNIIISKRQFDSTLNITFTWTSKRNSNDYASGKDVYYKDTSTIINNAFAVSKKMIKTIKHKERYKNIRVFYQHVNMDSNNDEDLLPSKYVDFKIINNDSIIFKKIKNP